MWVIWLFMIIIFGVVRVLELVVFWISLMSVFMLVLLIVKNLVFVVSGFVKVFVFRDNLLSFLVNNLILWWCLLLSLIWSICVWIKICNGGWFKWWIRFLMCLIFVVVFLMINCLWVFFILVGFVWEIKYCLIGVNSWVIVVWIFLVFVKFNLKIWSLWLWLCGLNILFEVRGEMCMIFFWIVYE